jgi:hypothetical protein
MDGSDWPRSVVIEQVVGQENLRLGVTEKEDCGSGDSRRWWATAVTGG